MPGINGIAHVELSVCDLDKSVRWYCELLGAQDVLGHQGRTSVGTLDRFGRASPAVSVNCLSRVAFLSGPGLAASPPVRLAFSAWPGRGGW
jgi:catechol 2,3-dioxygenase-like lactoylglutathione lyase family enzyme